MIGPVRKRCSTGIPNILRKEINMPSSKSGSGNTSKRGFASMDQEKQREIASKGGKAAHAKGTAHEFSSEEAREAGRKGGEASHGGGRGSSSSSRSNSSKQHGKAGS
jgi:general stress protein YciG